MKLESYLVKFRVMNTQSQSVLALHSNSESEAVFKLKQRGSVKQDASVIILSIEKK